MAISPKFFPTVLITINVMAAVVCFLHDDHKRAIYWLAAATLNWSITY